MAGAIALSATLLLIACGSTSPTQPSAATGSVASATVPSPLFTSLIGQWGGSVGISFLYLNPDDPARSALGSSHCELHAVVREHTPTLLSGYVAFKGTSLNTDKQCGSGFSFSAIMSRDGTFTSATLSDASLRSFECFPATPPVFQSGSANKDGFRVVVTDSTLCRWPVLTFTNNVPTREAERTFTVRADFRRGPLPPI